MMMKKMMMINNNNLIKKAFKDTEKDTNAILKLKFIFKAVSVSTYFK